MRPRIAVISFPGSNGDVENLCALRRCGLDAFVFRWNDSREKLEGVDGYFIGAGFAYEDRGRAGMVAGRDSIFQHLHDEDGKGKVILGCCNGAQVLVESGLVPFGSGLRMSLARNAVGGKAVGFLNEWVWMTRSCTRDRCASSDWDGVMQIPIAHGEGRFTTKDKDVMKELRKNDQIAFSYCDASGRVSDDPDVTPNGSLFAIAGICNPAGNVVALMPHPERTANGDPYFQSMRRWIGQGRGMGAREQAALSAGERAWLPIAERQPRSVEIFIDTIIVNNEERTVEQAAKRLVPSLRLKQLRYIAPGARDPADVLRTIVLFNPNKETAYVRRDGEMFRWQSENKRFASAGRNPLEGIALLRRDEPDTGAAAIGSGAETGICYVCRGAGESEIMERAVLEIFANPHASTLERLRPLPAA